METFSVDKISSVLVKPLKPTPSELLSFSSLDNNPKLENMTQYLYVYKPNDNFSGADPSSIIADALSKVLVYYYPLAGKLRRKSDGKLQLRCNTDGVPLVLAKATCKLSSVNYMDNIDANFTRQCVSDYSSESDDGYHPLVLQLTKFSCGGFVIGISSCHSVCDGIGKMQFFRALTELASGKMEPSVKPVWERERLVGDPTEEPFGSLLDIKSLATTPYLSSDLVYECFDVTAQSIKRLTIDLMKETNQKESFSTFEVLGAYVWRSRSRAMKLDSNGKCWLSLAFNIRGLLDPPFPEGYYGNAFLVPRVVMSGRDLDVGSLANVVKLIKQTKKLASSKDYIAKYLGYMEKSLDMNVSLGGAMAANMGLSDWRRLRDASEDVDFGWKKYVHLIPVPAINPILNMCVFLPPSTTKGGVKVALSLPRAAMAKFREEMNALMDGVGEDSSSHKFDQGISLRSCL